jgi:nucleotide-binding universal stress UspA family protein
MFKHILIPTDGSRLAAKGVKADIQLAKALGAKVSGLYVAFPYIPAMYGEAAIYYAGDGDKEYRKAARKQADKALAVIHSQARSAGVPCATQFVTSPQPWEAIVKAARAKKCDAVVMASHGRGGVGGLILGSETVRVLAHSKVPVVVVR